jgi:hypothetical protein
MLLNTIEPTNHLAASSYRGLHMVSSQQKFGSFQDEFVDRLSDDQGSVYTTGNFVPFSSSNVTFT